MASLTTRHRAFAPALFAGALGLAPLGLQPVLAQMGGGVSTDPTVISGCELAAMALACALCVNRPFPPLLCGLLMALGHAAALGWPDGAIVTRILAGLGEGGLCAVAVRALLCSPYPIRAASLFTGFSALPQIAGWLVQLRYPGPISAVLCLIASGLLAALIGRGCFHQPPSLSATSDERIGIQALLRLSAMTVLVAVLNFAGNLIWIDLENWLGRHAYASRDNVTAILFACMLGQIATTFAMARFGPERRIAYWLIAVCVLEAVGVFGLQSAPTGMAFVSTGILATAAWQASLPLATGLYLGVAGSGQGQLILPVSLGGMALGSGLADYVSPQRIIACLALLVVMLAAGIIMAGSGRMVAARA